MEQLGGMRLGAKLLSGERVHMHTQFFEKLMLTVRESASMNPLLGFIRIFYIFFSGTMNSNELLSIVFLH